MNYDNCKVYICGAHGIWKTAIASELAKNLNRYKAIDGSKFCIQYIEEILWILNPADNDITPRMKKEIIDNALKDWLKKIDWWVIVTWHWYLVPEVYTLFQHIIFIKANPEKIFEYRKNDLNRQSTRPRDISTIDEIRQEQLCHFERIKSVDISNKLIVVNNNDTLQEAVDEIIRLLSI